MTARRLVPSTGRRIRTLLFLANEVKPPASVERLSDRYGFSFAKFLTYLFW